MACGPITSWQIFGPITSMAKTVKTVTDFIFFFLGGGPKSLQIVTTAMKLKDICSLEKSYDQPRQLVIKHRHYFSNKGLSSQSYGFSISLV